MLSKMSNRKAFFCKSQYLNTIYISEDINQKYLDKAISGNYYTLISAIIINITVEIRWVVLHNILQVAKITSIDIIFLVNLET